MLENRAILSSKNQNDEDFFKNDILFEKTSKLRKFKPLKTLLQAKELKKILFFLAFFLVVFAQAQQLINLGTKVNGKYGERGPCISPDGKTLFFTRRFSPENIGGKLDWGDIYYSELQKNGSWSKAKSIGKPLNTKGHDFVCSISPDGKSILLNGNYYKNKEKLDGVSISYKTDTGWTFPENFFIRGFKKKGNYLDYFLSVDGNFLLLTNFGKDTYGRNDLYVCFKQGKNGFTWSQAKNLGNIINTKNEEDEPFLAADNKTLYFISRGHKGKGDFDIYVTYRLDSTWQNWTKPINLSEPINSAAYDCDFSLAAHGIYAYLSTDNGQKGNLDICKVLLNQAFRPKNVQLFTISTNDSSSYEKKLVVHKNGKIIESQIFFGQKTTIVVQDSGLYQFKIYNLYDELIENDSFSVANMEKYEEIELKTQTNFKTEKKDSIFIAYFDFDEHSLKNTEIQKLVTFLKYFQKSEIQCKLEAHTDAVGSTNYNWILGKNRLKFVKNLIEQSLQTNFTFIEETNFGETKALKSGKDPKNRKVMITIQAN